MYCVRVTITFTGLKIILIVYESTTPNLPKTLKLRLNLFVMMSLLDDLEERHLFHVALCFHGWKRVKCFALYDPMRSRGLTVGKTKRTWCGHNLHDKLALLAIALRTCCM
jgi:hypothetical protein